MKRLEQFFLLLLILLIPIQLGKHFWPHFAFVSGIRVDYLSPIMYFTDIVSLLLFGVLFGKVLIAPPKKIGRFTIFITLVSIVSFIALLDVISIESFVYSYLRIISYMIIGYSISNNMDQVFLKKTALFFVIISIGIFLLELVQFINQSSFQGIFYWLGERNFSLSTPGIARFSLGDRLLVRPYSTFPHPNVLAFYLFVSLLFARYLLVKAKNLNSRGLYIAMYAIVFTALLLTFSRVLIFCAILLLFLDLVKKRLGIVLFVCLIIGSFIYFSGRFMPSQAATDLTERISHAIPLIGALDGKWIWGLGLNQYFYYQIEIERILSPYFLQPIHNVPLLILIQLGLAGLAFFTWGVYQTFKKVILLPSSSEKELKVILLTTLLFACFFDHYFITLHQGMLLTGLVFGIAWSRQN